MGGVAPLRGEVWYADFGNPIGHEQGGARPCLVVSHDRWNRGRSGLVIALPLTTGDKGFPHHIRVDPPEAGLDRTAFVKCEDVRSISALRLQRSLGMVSGPTMHRVEETLRLLLGLWETRHEESAP